MRESGCIFCKIATGEIPTELILETEHCVVFKDLHPAAPIHCLVIPKEHIPTLNDLPDADPAIWTDLLHTATATAAKFGLSDDGWRLVTNINRGGGQTVFHLHMHVLGGRQMGWPPG